VQSDHQPRRQPGAAFLGVEPAEGFIEAAPVDQSGQPNLLMAHVDHVLQPAAEHVSFVLGLRRFGAH